MSESAHLYFKWRGDTHDYDVQFIVPRKEDFVQLYIDLRTNVVHSSYLHCMI